MLIFDICWFCNIFDRILCFSLHECASINESWRCRWVIMSYTCVGVDRTPLKCSRWRHRPRKNDLHVNTKGQHWRNTGDNSAILNKNMKLTQCFIKKQPLWLPVKLMRLQTNSQNPFTGQFPRKCTMYLWWKHVSLIYYIYTLPTEILNSKYKVYATNDYIISFSDSNQLHFSKYVWCSNCMFEMSFFSSFTNEYAKF